MESFIFVQCYIQELDWYLDEPKILTKTEFALIWGTNFVIVVVECWVLFGMNDPTFLEHPGLSCKNHYVH